MIGGRALRRAWSCRCRGRRCGSPTPRLARTSASRERSAVERWSRDSSVTTNVSLTEFRLAASKLTPNFRGRQKFAGGRQRDQVPNRAHVVRRQHNVRTAFKASTSIGSRPGAAAAHLSGARRRAQSAISVCALGSSRSRPAASIAADGGLTARPGLASRSAGPITAHLPRGGRCWFPTWVAR